MNILTEFGIEYVRHYTPLHYLPFLVRAKSLKSKATLLSEGFSITHFRSKSKTLDVKRGFDDVVHLMIKASPRILIAKLMAGFPHVEIKIPTTILVGIDYDLCRYNIAMTRRLQSSPTGGFNENDENGRYYPGLCVPVARSDNEKRSLLQAHLSRSTIIELLVNSQLSLPDTTRISAFSPEDADIVDEIIDRTASSWQRDLSEPAGYYPRSAEYSTEVETFIEKLIIDPFWRGDGLEFDRL